MGRRTVLRFRVAQSNFFGRKNISVFVKERLASAGGPERSAECSCQYDCRNGKFKELETRDVDANNKRNASGFPARDDPAAGRTKDTDSDLV